MGPEFSFLFRNSTQESERKPAPAAAPTTKLYELDVKLSGALTTAISENAPFFLTDRPSVPVHNATYYSHLRKCSIISD